MSLPWVLVSSVVRSTHQGESHGGLYLVDLESGQFEEVFDWRSEDIDWGGRGGERGLRGIAFHEGQVLLASSHELVVLDQAFNVVASYGNRYLKGCHEIATNGSHLFLTSTGFDSILEFDLTTKVFTKGYCLRYTGLGRRLNRYHLRPMPRLRQFDPLGDDGPQEGDTLHINNVHCEGGRLYVSGTRIGRLLFVEDGVLRSFRRIPYTTHNARPYKGGVLMNHTRNDRVLWLGSRGQVVAAYEIVRYDPSALEMSDLPRDHARQAFGRGLSVGEDGLIIAGSSPATISAYREGESKRIMAVNLTMDVRNAVHGLETWPY